MINELDATNWTGVEKFTCQQKPTQRSDASHFVLNDQTLDNCISVSILACCSGDIFAL
jgi:hypothetical protein